MSDLDEDFKKVVEEDKKELELTAKEKALRRLAQVINYNEVVKKAQEEKLLNDELEPTKRYKSIEEMFLEASE